MTLTSVVALFVLVVVQVKSWQSMKEGMDLFIRHLKQKQLPDEVFPDGVRPASKAAKPPAAPVVPKDEAPKPAPVEQLPIKEEGSPGAPANGAAAETPPKKKAKLSPRAESAPEVELQVTAPPALHTPQGGHCRNNLPLTSGVSPATPRHQQNSNYLYLVEPLGIITPAFPCAEMRDGHCRFLIET